MKFVLTVAAIASPFAFAVGPERLIVRKGDNLTLTSECPYDRNGMQSLTSSAGSCVDYPHTGVCYPIFEKQFSLTNNETTKIWLPTGTALEVAEAEVRDAILELRGGQALTSSTDICIRHAERFMCLSKLLHCSGGSSVTETDRPCDTVCTPFYANCGLLLKSYYTQFLEGGNYIRSSYAWCGVKTVAPGAQFDTDLRDVYGGRIIENANQFPNGWGDRQRFPAVGTDGDCTDYMSDPYTGTLPAPQFKCGFRDTSNLDKGYGTNSPTAAIATHWVGTAVAYNSAWAAQRGTGKCGANCTACTTKLCASASTTSVALASVFAAAFAIFA